MRFTGYKQARIAKKVSWPSDLPLNEAGEIISEIQSSEDLERKKQAILLLENEENPDETKYKELAKFKVGQKVGYYKNGEISGNTDTRIFSPECIEDDFKANKTSLSYGVSFQGKGFNFNDTVQVYSVRDSRYLDYTITSKPDWIKLSKGTTKSLTNNLNLIVDRNRTDDDDRHGNIVLTQNKTNKEITIKVTQKGRLTEGIPTEYPYVNSDTILDKPYPVVQLGEQIWMQEPLKDGAMISQNIIDSWKASYPNKYVPTKAEFDEVYVSGWTKVRKNDIQTALENKAGGINIFSHMLPIEPDIYELAGFILADTGSNGDWGTFKQGSLGVTLVKEILDITKNGYDDVRQSYPKTWINALNTGTVTDNEVKTGSDKYALGYKTAGLIQAYGDGGTANNPMYGCMQFHSRGDDPDSSSAVLVFGYSLSEDHHKRGIYRRVENTAYISKNIRTLKYRKLPYELYTDATTDLNGTSIIRVNEGEPIPLGFTVLERGARRGLFLGNPNLTFQAIKDMSGWIGAFLQNTGSGIG